MSGRLEEIGSRADAASPGPWEPREDISGWWLISGSSGTEQDARFIANAREDVPWLLSRLEAAEADARQQREDMAELLRWTLEHVDAYTEDGHTDEEIITSLRCIVTGELGCTEEADYTPVQWRIVQFAATLKDASPDGDATPTQSGASPEGNDGASGDAPPLGRA